MRILVRILKFLLPLVVIGVATLAAVIMIRNRPEVETQIPEVAPPGVRVHLVEVDTVQVPVTSQGTVRPGTETQIVPEIAGRVTWVAPSFAAGGFFEEGDVLLRIDPFDYEQAVVSARSQVAQSKLRLAQEEAEAEVALREWEELGRGNPRELTLRKPQLEDAKASVAAAEAGLVRAERDLERADVTAPYAGRVRSKNVDVGQFVTVGTAIATVYAVDVAEIRLPLPDEELAYLDLPLAYRGPADQDGPRVRFHTTFAGATHEWMGRIVRTESEIDPVSRMVHVVAEVRDPYAASDDPNRPPLAVGMYVEAEIEGRAFDEIVVVPRAALQGRNQVLTIDVDSRVRFREIDILRTTTESVYVRSGLTQGELVAISALDGPTDGMLVQITDISVDAVAEGPTGEPTRSTAPVAESSAIRSRPDPVTDAAFVAPALRAEPERPAWLVQVYRENALATRLTRRATTVPPPPPTPKSPPLTTVAGDDVSEPSEPDLVVDAASPVIDRATAVAVLPFINITQGGTTGELGSGLTKAVSMRLEDLESVMVVSSETDAGWVVGGGVQRLGDTVRVTARVVDTRDGDIVRAVKVDGTASDMPRVRDEVAAAIEDGIIDALGIVATAGPVESGSSDRIVVRAFNNVSQAPADADLAQAIVNAVTDRLLTLETVSVVAEESTAAWIITGGIQRVGNSVRVTATLIDVAEGTVVRSVKVDGLIDQLDRLQSEVASELSDSVREVTS